MFHSWQPNDSPQSPPVRRADAGKIPAPAPNGHLTPATGPAWDITTTARRHAAAITAAIPDATVSRAGQGQWRTRIPRQSLTVTATHADADALTVTLDEAPAAGPIALTFHPWTAADVMPLLPAELPARGRLSIRDIRISTLMGRTVRYLIPAFTATA
jgi:hypothetical protein